MAGLTGDQTELHYLGRMRTAQQTTSPEGSQEQVIGTKLFSANQGEEADVLHLVVQTKEQSLANDVNKLSLKIRELEEDKEITEKEKKDLHAKISDLTLQFRELTLQFRRLEEAVKDKEIENKDLHAANSDLKLQIKRLEIEKEDLRAKIEKFRGKFEEVFDGSNSK